MKAIIIASVMSLVSMAAYSAQAAVYEWVDDKGVVHFTDNADKIPDKYLKRAKEKSQENDRVTVTSPSGMEGTPAAGSNLKPVPVQDEEQWRSRFGSLREQIKGLENGLVAKRERLSTLRRKKAVYQRGTDRAAYGAQLEEIERDEARLKELDQQLQALDAEAAKVGVPLEWRQ